MPKSDLLERVPLAGETKDMQIGLHRVALVLLDAINDEEFREAYLGIFDTA